MIVEQRRARAAERQAEYDKLSVDEKLYRAYTSRGEQTRIVTMSDAMKLAQEQWDRKMHLVVDFPKQLKKLLRQKFEVQPTVSQTPVLSESEQPLKRLTEEQKKEKKKAHKAALKALHEHKE